MFRYMFGVWLSDGSLIKALIIAVYLVSLVLYRPDLLQVKVLPTLILCSVPVLGTNLKDQYSDWRYYTESGSGHGITQTLTILDIRAWISSGDDIMPFI